MAVGGLIGVALGAEVGLTIGDGDSPAAPAALAPAGAAPASAESQTVGVPSSSAPLGPFHPVRGPVDYGEADARFGASRGRGPHEGQDLFADPGTPLLAVHAGEVVARGADAGRGNYVGIYSPEEEQTYVYLHMLHRSPLRRGERVDAGTVVGRMGCTGACNGTHLHFEIRRRRGIRTKAIDPRPLLKRWRRIELDSASAD